MTNIKIIKSLLLSIIAFVMAATVQAASPISEFEITYLVIRNDTELGTSQRKLMPLHNDSWLFRSKTVPDGVISWFFDDTIEETSVIQFDEQQVLPQKYVYLQLDDDDIEKQHRVRFDWESGFLFRNDNKTDDTLVPNTHDIMSFTLQLMLDLQQGSKKMNYVIVDRKRAEEFKLTVTGDDVLLETENGNYNTVRIESTSRSNNKFIIWCAKDINFLPVKIQKTEPDGDVIELIVQKHSF